MTVSTLGLTAALILADAPWTIDRVKSEVAAHRDRLRSLRIEFDTAGRGTDTPPGVVDRRRLVFAAKGVKRYAESGHVYPGFAWDEDPNATLSFYTGQSYDAFWIARRVYRSSRADAKGVGTLRVRGDLFTECTGWWPPDDDTLPPDPFRPETLLHRAVGAAGAAVRPGLEAVGPARCVVVELAKGERLWLDADRGCAIVRRVIPDVRDGLHMLCENADFVQPAPGVWLPTRLRRVVHRGVPGTVGTGADAVWMEAEYMARHVAVNAVPDDQFTFTPPPGTIVSDKDKGEDRAVPGGLDFLDYSCRVGRKRMPPAAAPQASWQPAVLGIDAVAVALALPAVGLILRRRAGNTNPLPVPTGP